MQTDRKEYSEWCGDVARYCVCGAVRRVARIMTQLYDAHLQPSGLRSTQFHLLATAVCMKAANGTLSVTDLANEMAMDRTTLSRNLNPLVARGIVAIGAGNDRRVRDICVTERGHAAFRQAFPLWQQAQTQIGAHLGKKCLDQLQKRLNDAEKLYPKMFGGK